MKVHDIGKLLEILKNDGYDIRHVDFNNDFINNKGKITFNKCNYNFKPFNEETWMFIITMVFITVVALMFSCVDITASIATYLLCSIISITLLYNFGDIKKNIIIMSSTFIISSLLFIFFGYHISLNQMESDLIVKKRDKEFVEKYEKMNAIPRRIFYLK